MVDEAMKKQNDEFMGSDLSLAYLAYLQAGLRFT